VSDPYEAAVTTCGVVWCCVVLCEDRSNDDRSYGTYSSAMLEIKNNRKRAEGDLQLLENRILLLKVIWVYDVGG
jgi:hypothetical protein